MAEEPPRARVDDGWGVLSTLLTGVLMWGGLGWLADRLLSTAVFLPVGLVAGAALAIVTIYARYSRPQGPR